MRKKVKSICVGENYLSYMDNKKNKIHVQLVREKNQKGQFFYFVTVCSPSAKINKQGIKRKFNKNDITVRYFNNKQNPTWPSAKTFEKACSEDHCGFLLDLQKALSGKDVDKKMPCIVGPFPDSVFNNIRKPLSEALMYAAHQKYLNDEMKESYIQQESPDYRELTKKRIALSIQKQEQNVSEIFSIIDNDDRQISAFRQWQTHQKQQPS